MLLSVESMPRVEVFSWNPRKSRLPGVLARVLHVGHRVDNFGDLLGPMIVAKILAMNGVDPRGAVSDRRLLSIGSVMHFAHDCDVIWGTGVNGKVPESAYRFGTLDVRAVRGPRTRAFLASRGVDAPAIFGDPALLLPAVFPELLAQSRTKRHAVVVVPNFNDFDGYSPSSALLDPRSSVDLCLRRIAESELVVGSSLHAIIVAESLGIPARLIASPVEDRFKYDDYFAGTGRTDVRFASTVEEAVSMGGELGPVFDQERLLSAFPFDLWRP